MDLTDIFDSDGSSSETVASLKETARKAADAYDAAVKADASHSALEDRLLREMHESLATLRDQRNKAMSTLKASVRDLMDAMDKAGVTKIPMDDRPDIVIKETPGRRKSITKKWLIETYGPERAKEIWDSVPLGPKSRDVIIPDRYDDEPEHS